MDSIFMLIALLSFVALIVGLFSPKTVKCSSRGKVALIFSSVFIVSAFIGGSLSEKQSGGNISTSGKDASVVAKEDVSENTAPKAQEEPNKGASENMESKDQDAADGIPVLTKGSVYTMPYANKEVQIVFKNIRVNRIPNDGRNLIFTLRIKNNSNENFFVSNLGWKLLDSDRVEVEESGIYEPVFEDFAPGTFFFTIVEPNIGKEEKVGYSVIEDTYYLSIDGRIIGKIPVGKR